MTTQYTLPTRHWGRRSGLILLLAASTLAACGTAPTDPAVTGTVSAPAAGDAGAGADVNGDAAAAGADAATGAAGAADAVAANGDSAAGATGAATAANKPGTAAANGDSAAGATAGTSQQISANTETGTTATPIGTDTSTGRSGDSTPLASSDGSYAINAGGRISNGRTVCVQNGDTLFLSINTTGNAGMSAEISTARGLILTNFAMQTEGPDGQIITYSPEAFDDGSVPPANVTRDGASFRISGADVEGYGDFDVTITCP
ncbi:MAG: hypothetical protein SPI77_02010 [Corynebacterium sp.]|nr:hypothetical protein [Corynebacterium sp.]